MARIRPYYAQDSLSAAFYEVVTAADASLAGDIDLYAGLKPPGATVLELGTGSGRIALALAERGFSVVGVDLAPAMLAQARARLEQAPAQTAAGVELRLGDMTSLNLGRTFDLVLCPFFTLAHVPAGAAWKNTFSVMAKHLAQDGLAAVHLPLAEALRQPPPPPEAVVLDRPLPSGGRLQMHVRERSFREPIGRFDQVVEYVERDAQGRELRRSAERLTYYMADPLPFAEAAGLTSVQPPQRFGRVGDIWLFARR